MFDSFKARLVSFQYSQIIREFATDDWINTIASEFLKVEFLLRKVISQFLKCFNAGELFQSNSKQFILYTIVDEMEFPSRNKFLIDNCNRPK